MMSGTEGMGSSARELPAFPIFTHRVHLQSSIKPMKLDATDLRYVTSEEFRVLTAVWNSGHFVD